MKQSSDTGNDWANNAVAVAEEQLLQSHVSAFEELNSIMVNEPVLSVNQVIQSCADESCVSGKLQLPFSNFLISFMSLHIFAQFNGEDYVFFSS